MYIIVFVLVFGHVGFLDFLGFFFFVISIYMYLKMMKKNKKKQKYTKQNKKPSIRTQGLAALARTQTQIAENGVLGWSPWKYVIQWALPNSKEVWVTAVIGPNGIVHKPPRIFIKFVVLCYNQNYCRKWKYLSKYGILITTYVLTKQQEYV